MLDGVLANPQQLPVELVGEHVGLALDAADRRAMGNLRHLEDGSQIEVLRLPVVLPVGREEQVRPANDLVEGAKAHLAELFPHFLGHEEEVVDDLLGRSGKLGTEDRVLRGDADRAGVQMALPHHHAAHGDQGGRGEAVFLGAQAGGDDDVAAGLELAVGLEPDPASQAVANQGLLGLGQAQLPGNARVADARERRGAGAAAIAADENPVGVSLGDARWRWFPRPRRRPA